MADLHPPIMAILVPDTPPIPRLSLVKIDSCPVFVVTGLVGKIVAADPDTLAETQLAGADEARAAARTTSANIGGASSLPTTAKPSDFIKRFLLCSDHCSHDAIAVMRE
ncbi:hypothetical protein [Rhizobium sp. JAB6]|uniref:hypothetical protein n=1 Tax=Rhizobium sp. JAB6 TaxID=2127050 RepID=UPI0013AF6823|nr:hypothetical protein [Rhizobium sp. JAB6]